VEWVTFLCIGPTEIIKHYSIVTHDVLIVYICVAYAGFRETCFFCKKKVQPIGFLGGEFIGFGALLGFLA